MSLLLASARELKRLDLATTTGRWGEVYSRSILSRIYGETVGIVGFGWIGRAVARKCNAFGMNVLVSDPYVGDHLEIEYGVEFVSKDELLKRSDYVTLHVPHLAGNTHHYIDSKALEEMKPSAYLINTSRGPVVDEKALAHALQQNQIAGAGIDVFEEEPLSPDNPILKMDNVIVTPHAIGSTDEIWQNKWDENISQVASIIKGEVPEALVNGNVWNQPLFQAKLKRFQEAI